MAFEYNFDEGDEGWTAGFADLPVDYDQDIYELGSGHRALPSGLTGSGMYLQGHNRSDDLFMYLTRRVGGVADDRAQLPEEMLDLKTRADFVSSVGLSAIAIAKRNPYWKTSLRYRIGNAP